MIKIQTLKPPGELLSPASAQMRSWLEAHGLGDLEPHFTEHDITQDMLPGLTGEDLQAIGITSLGLRKKVLAAIHPHREGPSAVSHTPLEKPAPPSPGQVMAPPQQPAAPSPPPKAKRKLFSAGFLAVSIGFHLLLGLGAGYWVVQQMAAKRKLQFSSGPPTTSPSKRALEHKVSLQKRKNAGGAPAQAKRISVQGLASNITLPEMPAMPTSNEFVAGRMSGMGGAGFGTGLGFGNGSGMGVGGMGMGGLGLTMFGTRGGGGLEGTFYDLKQTKDRQPNGMNPNQYNGVIRAWIEGGLKESTMQQYFRAPTKLYATQFVMPDMAADEAPKAYGVGKLVKPSQWVAHYKGKVSPPKSGTYQFLGAGDDTLVVFFDRKLVLDASWFPVTGLQPKEIVPEGNYVDFPRRGYVKGEPFNAMQGQWYDIDILVGEQPGGRFFSCLCVEEEGKKGLSLFRVSSGRLPKLHNPPPFDTNGPAWRVLGRSSANPMENLNR